MIFQPFIFCSMAACLPAAACPAFFDMHSQKNILRHLASYLFSMYRPRFNRIIHSLNRNEHVIFSSNPVNFSYPNCQMNDKPLPTISCLFQTNAEDNRTFAFNSCSADFQRFFISLPFQCAFREAENFYLFYDSMKFRRMGCIPFTDCWKMIDAVRRASHGDCIEIASIDGIAHIFRCKVLFDAVGKLTFDNLCRIFSRLCCRRLLPH